LDLVQGCGLMNTSTRTITMYSEQEVLDELADESLDYTYML